MRIALLGTLQVGGDGGRTAAIGGPRVRALLIFLALEAGRVVPAEWLIGQLWEGDPPAGAANALQSLVSRLRAALRAAGLDRDVIESHPAGYRLAVPRDAVDAYRFELIAERGAAALASGEPERASPLLREALALWHGPALADAAGAEFALAPAARLEELHLAAVADRIDADLALGAGPELVGELQAMVSADPLAERPRAQLMRALYAAGRQADALAVYQEGRALLADRLGIDPSPELQDTYLAVLRHDLVLRQAAGAVMHEERLPLAPGNTGVRAPLTSFVGRDEEVAQVGKLLAGDRLVTLTGPGGAGKTRLAAELARAEQGSGRWPDGVWFIELASLADPGELVSAVLTTLGVRETALFARSGRPEQPDPLQRLAAALGAKRLLLVLDNCEHLVEAAAALADQLLARCPDLRILGTSRQALGITGEVLWPVQPLAFPSGQPAEPDAVDALRYPAVRLLRDRGSAVLPGFDVDERNVADVVRICRALDGIPLAIELAAARLRTLSPAQVAQRLDDRFALLSGGSRTAMPRHQTLRAVVAWSWDLLDEPERVLLRRLSVLAGGASLGAVEAVCAGGPLAAGAVLDALIGLVDKSLVTAVPTAGDGPRRYRMLETVRAYGLERLAEAGEYSSVRRAHAAYFLGLAEEAEPALRTAEQLTWMRGLVTEHDNIHAALRWTLDERDADLALRFGAALSWYWWLRGERAESAAWARQILEVPAPPVPGDGAPASARAATAQARAACAVMACWPDFGRALVRDSVSAALAACEEAGTRPHPMLPIVASAVAVYFEHDEQRALSILGALLDVPDEFLSAIARVQYAVTLINLGRAEEAARHGAAALAQFRALGERWGLAMALMLKAERCGQHGDHLAAMAALEEAAALAREFWVGEDLTHIYGMLAAYRRRSGDLDGARADLATAWEIAARVGEKNPYLPLIEAELARHQGEYGRARRLCEQSIEFVAELPDAYSQAGALGRSALAALLLEQGEQAAARDVLADALETAAASRDRPVTATVVETLAGLALLDGRPEHAAVLLGAGHGLRGVADQGSYDAPRFRAGARNALGAGAFDAAYARGRALSPADAVVMARS